ncbi:MAG: metallopeptidase TldD-related protein [Candidatus Cloacimonadaceae bacterium]|jgi:predicted Zn-dependent protease|nr:hypothetical protein [Candidatus Cloacimonadota bacterium]MDY0127888.1 metallopeptidase TldD-related protein [Candidatus Cloacimonadaceae bacterium]MCB5254922.1 hypothetical protein [Candidatus Cloacimonadota bacterium]MCK9179005.1 metallopeptidase TldD-related protein [Candidatus Cloacimonadota bacterium]MCK9242051.1 metallopeptidase TldD-related protein [Candidatus Cloacimonadota bacterium]
MKIQNIVKYIREHTDADDFICSIREDNSHETRFAQNGITQHISGPKLQISLQLSFGTKSGSCRVNQADEATLGFLIKTATDIACLAPEDPEHMASSGPAELPRVENCAPATMNLQPKDMVDIVQKSIDKAIAMDAMVSGMCEKHLVKSWLFTKNGFEGSNESSSFGHSMTLKKGEVETKVSYEAKDYAPFNLEEEFSRLSSQATALASMQDFDAQKIAVILRPEALQELIWYMSWMMNRRQSDEGFTAFTGQLGQQFMGEKFSLYSTLKQKSLSASPYSPEGLPSRETTWIENGLLKNMPANRYWAQKVGCNPLHIFNLYIPGGESTEEEMMKMVPRGLIINRFWYIRTVDMKAGELTGMTRDGVLYFEDGKVRHAVNNLRFNEIPHDMTRRILALGTEKLASPAMIVPTALIDSFNFVDKTSF